MAIDDLSKKAKDFLGENSDKVQEALKSEQAESISDKILDGLSDAANKVTGGKHSDQVEDFKNKLDGKIGNE